VRIKKLIPDTIPERSVKIPLIVCAVAAVIARLTGIISSYFATDIMYEGTLVTTVLPYFPMILQAVSFAAVAVALAVCIRDDKKTSPSILLYVAVLLADTVAVILYDSLSGYYAAEYPNVGVEFYTYIILYRLFVASFSVLLLFVAWAIMRFMTKKGCSHTPITIVGAIVPVAVDLGAVLWQSISAMIEREFILLETEIISILIDCGMILICAAAAVATVILVNLSYKKVSNE